MNNKKVIAMVNRNGPEHAPLKNYVKDFKIVLTVYDKDDNVVREEKLNYGKHEDRIWLGKLSYFYWTAGYVVETREDKS